MSFDTPAKVKKLCEKYNFRPNKKRGQNFLIDKNVIDKIIRQSGVNNKDYVLEIGPGLGVLTDRLATKAKKVLSVEIDRKIIEILKNEFKWNNVEIINKDILRLDNQEIVRKLNKDYLLIANLPYQITSSILEKFLAHGPRPKKMVIMVQREVGERMAAQAPRMNLLGLLVQFYGKTKILFRVKKNCFWPVPQVDSVVVEIIPKKKPIFEKKSHEKDFWAIVRAGYRSKRKFLLSNLANYTHLPKAKIRKVFFDLNWDEKIRPERLSLDEWITFFNKIK